MDKEEHQAMDISTPQCACGNNLSIDRQELGITNCPACDKVDVIDVEDALKAEQAKVKKLEGWLKLLYYHHCDDIETDKTLQEISDYIKAMEGK